MTTPVAVGTAWPTPVYTQPAELVADEVAPLNVPQPHIAALVANPVMADFNNLLTVLQTAGILKSS